MPNTIQYIRNGAFENTELIKQVDVNGLVYIDNWVVKFVESDTNKNIILK